MGVTFCAVAPEHPLAAARGADEPDASPPSSRSARPAARPRPSSRRRRRRACPPACSSTHPLTHEKIEVWVGNYVLMSYGDGAVMGVPGHDERDFAFAKKYGIDIMQVIHVDGAPHFSYDHWQDWYADKTGRRRGVTINSDIYSGLDVQAARSTPSRRRSTCTGLGDKKTTWRLRDWGVSRQRYWGTPIPIIHCAEVRRRCRCPRRDLPVVLPEDLIPDGSGNPLNKHAAFLNVACPTCGQPARRETDTMDTFVDSSWYFMRYCDPTNDRRDGRRRARSTGCRWTSTSAASSTRSCTCCTRASGPR